MSKPTQDDVYLMSRLRDVLLKEDRSELERLRALIEDHDQLSDKITPIIEERINFLKKNFPKEFRQVVDNIVDKKIKSSQAEMMDTLYPVIGQMIKKYINYQFQMLKDSLDKRVKEALGAKNWWWKIRRTIFGLSDSDVLLQNLDRPFIEEVYVIQRDSGLLIGSASLHEMMDKEVIAGMLTAIKAFVEDAFQREKQDLELIQYGSYKVLLYNFHSFYVSVAMSGSISAAEKERIFEQLQSFALTELSGYQHGNLDHINSRISEQLDTYFIAPQREIDAPESVRVSNSQAVLAYD